VRLWGPAEEGNWQLELPDRAAGSGNHGLFRIRESLAVAGRRHLHLEARHVYQGGR